MIYGNATHHQAGGHKETRSGIAIKQQHDGGSQKHAESQQDQNGGDKPCPAGERHAHPGHPTGAQLNRSGDEVDGPQKGSEAEESNAGEPQVGSASLAWPGGGNGAQRRILGPTRERRASGNEEGGQQHQ